MNHPIEPCFNPQPHEPHEWHKAVESGVALDTEERWCVGVPDEPEPEKYTLDEAKMIFLRQACATEGHEWSLTSNAKGVPLVVFCTRGCGVPAGTITFPYESD